MHWKILDLSENIDKNVQKKHEGSKFALIVDESTDISSSAQLLVFVRFINDDEVINQFLCCMEIPTTTSGQDIFYIYIKRSSCAKRSSDSIKVRL